jgi:hypothetical protein
MRPERDISASCELFASVIAVMFTFHAQVLTTAEFFMLAIAMRIPIQSIYRAIRVTSLLKNGVSACVIMVWI